MTSHVSRTRGVATDVYLRVNGADGTYGYARSLQVVFA